MRLCIPIRPIDGPQAVIRVDPAPGFLALKDDALLGEHNISLDLGRVKNINKNPVAERGVEELELELLKQNPSGGQVSELMLATATERLNARIRSRGLSSREMLFQRDQFTNDQIPLTDLDLIVEQHQAKLKNHPYSEISKAPNKAFRPVATVEVGDLVYLHRDSSKLKSRARYIVTSTEGEWVYLRKFSGNQLRNVSYKVKRSECFKVPPSLPSPVIPHHVSTDSSKDIDTDHQFENTITVLNESLSTNTIPVSNLSDNHEETFDQVSRTPILEEHEFEEPMVPEVIIPQPESQDNTDHAELHRSQRNRKPPERLIVDWGSKSYT